MQTWDGEGDIKVYAGHVNAGSEASFEIGSDYAPSDFISVGGQITYVSVKKHDEGRNNFSLDYDLSLTDSCHWAEVLKLPPVPGIYSGVSVGLRTVGLQVGVRYNSSETLGLYGQMRQNLFKAFDDDVERGRVY